MALFLETLVPVLHQPASAALPDGVSAVNLCMAPGSAPPAPSDTDKSLVHGARACAICQTLHMLGGGFLPPASAAIAPALSTAKVSVVPSVAVVLDGRAVSQARARAPPLKA